MSQPQETKALRFSGAFATSPEAFTFFRFLTGFSVKGLFMMAFVLSVECVGQKFAAFIGIALSIPFAIGELILGLEAYLIRDWRTLQLVVHAPVLGLVLLWFVLPESPRWLMAAGKTRAAEKILTKAAKMNRKSIPETMIPALDDEKESKEAAPGLRKTFTNLRKVAESYDFKKDLFSKKSTDKEAAEKGSELSMTAASSSMMTSSSFFDLFRPREMMFRTVNLCFQWFSVTFVYYGLSFGSTSLSGDPYLNFCLSIFVEIPANLFAMAVMDCWGRKPIVAFCQILPGLACVFAGLLVENAAMAPLQVSLAIHLQTWTK